MWASVCAQDADFTVLSFLQPMSTNIYVYPSTSNTRLEMCHTCRWECFVFQRHGLCIGLFYCFNDTACFTWMYFVSNDEIKTVSWVWPLLGKHYPQFKISVNKSLPENVDQLVWMYARTISQLIWFADTSNTKISSTAWIKNYYQYVCQL